MKDLMWSKTIQSFKANGVPLQNILSSATLFLKSQNDGFHKISLMTRFSFPILVIHNGQWLSKARVDGLGDAKGVRWGRQISLTAGGWNEVLQKQGVQSQRHSVELQVHYYQRTDKARLWGLGFGEGERSPVHRPRYDCQSETWA